MAEIDNGTQADAVDIPPMIRQYKRTISDLLPDKYEFSTDSHLYIASSVPVDILSSYAEETIAPRGLEHGDSVDKPVTRCQTSGAVGLASTADSKNPDSMPSSPRDTHQQYDADLEGGCSDSLPAPVVAEHTAGPSPTTVEIVEEPQPFTEPLTAQEVTSVRAAAEDYSLPEPKMPRPVISESGVNSTNNAEDIGSRENGEANIIPPENTETAGDEDASHSMLLQALADLQADNASLARALSAQNQELQALRIAAQHNDVKETTAPERAAPEAAEEEEHAGDDVRKEDATAAITSGEEAPIEEMPPKDMVDARYRSLELKVQRLKAERDQMEKALRREVGDDTPLAKLLDADSDWRGRAQRIALLKERLLSLHETHAQVMGTPSNARNRHDISNRANLERLRGERMKEVDELHAELASTRAALEDSLSKQQGVAARKKALEKEVRSLKAKVGLLLDKSATDDSLIAALRSHGARSGAFASSQLAFPQQAAPNQAGSSSLAFPTGSGALTGPVVAWEGPERGGSRVSLVVPGAPAPDQAPAGGDQFVTAESASVQRTSFSISLDINTNIVSIQGSVVSPNLADKPMISVSDASKDCGSRCSPCTGIETGVTVDPSAIEESVEAVKEGEGIEEDEEAAVDQSKKEEFSNVAAEMGHRVEADEACDCEMHGDGEEGKYQEAAKAATGEEYSAGNSSASAAENITEDDHGQEQLTVTPLEHANTEEGHVKVQDAAQGQAGSSSTDIAVEQAEEHGAEEFLSTAADYVLELHGGNAENGEGPVSVSAVHEAVDTVIAEMQDLAGAEGDRD